MNTATGAARPQTNGCAGDLSTFFPVRPLCVTGLKPSVNGLMQAGHRFDPVTNADMWSKGADAPATAGGTKP
jgi:hypothetical protein